MYVELKKIEKEDYQKPTAIPCRVGNGKGCLGLLMTQAQYQIHTAVKLIAPVKPGDVPTILVGSTTAQK